MPIVIGTVVAVVLVLGGVMMWSAGAKTNKVAMASAPKPVTVVVAKAATYRASHVYVGTLEPWVAAMVGPQFVSAYVDTVLVRPGSIVTKNEVLATLDCRNATAANQAVSMQARAIDEQQKAVASEAARLRSLLDGGFVSPNEAERRRRRRARRRPQSCNHKERR